MLADYIAVKCLVGSGKSTLMAKLAYTLGKKISLVIVKSEGFNVLCTRDLITG